MTAARHFAARPWHCMVCASGAARSTERMRAAAGFDLQTRSVRTAARRLSLRYIVALGTYGMCN